MTVLKLPGEVRARIESHAHAGYPEETCGLLIGHQADGVVSVCAAPPARNVNRERPEDRYELDPLAMLRADRDARCRGLEVVGVWHTHPDHAAQPSATDRAAAWEGWSYLIVSVTRRGVGEVRSWRLAGDAFREEGVEP
ncbi:MAG: M67 family metallopeptidase [Gammaproteobacteria bacterium]